MIAGHVPTSAEARLHTLWDTLERRGAHVDRIDTTDAARTTLVALAEAEERRLRVLVEDA